MRSADWSAWTSRCGVLPPPAIARAFASHLPTLGADFVQTVLRAILAGCAAGLLAAIALDRSDFLRRGVIPLGSFAAAMPIVGMGFRISTEAARMNLRLVWAEIVLASLTGTLAFAVLSLLECRVAFWHPSSR